MISLDEPVNFTRIPDEYKTEEEEFGIIDIPNFRIKIEYQLGDAEEQVYDLVMVTQHEGIFNNGKNMGYFDRTFFYWDTWRILDQNMRRSHLRRSFSINRS